MSEIMALLKMCKGNFKQIQISNPKLCNDPLYKHTIKQLSEAIKKLGG